MYTCIKAVSPVLTFDKSYQVGQEISEFEYENLDVKLRNHFAPVGEPPVEPTDTTSGLEGTFTGNPDAPDPIILDVDFSNDNTTTTDPSDLGGGGEFGGAGSTDSY